MKRVVITGFGALSPLGHDWPTVSTRLRAMQNAVQVMPEWSRVEGLNTRVAAPALPFELPDYYEGERTRRMGRVALMGTRATELALHDAGLSGNPILQSGAVGVSYVSAPIEK